MRSTVRLSTDSGLRPGNYPPLADCCRFVPPQVSSLATARSARRHLPPLVCIAHRELFGQSVQHKRGVPHVDTPADRYRRRCAAGYERALPHRRADPRGRGSVGGTDAGDRRRARRPRTRVRCRIHRPPDACAQAWRPKATPAPRSGCAPGSIGLRAGEHARRRRQGPRTPHRLGRERRAAHRGRQARRHPRHHALPYDERREALPGPQPVEGLRLHPQGNQDAGRRKLVQQQVQGRKSPP